MSDHNYLCELFGLHPLEEHELVETVLADDEELIRNEHDKEYLDIGRIVHLVWLTTDSPARVREAKFNVQLEERFHFGGFNHLQDASRENPASWFLKMGFTVRSKKVGGNWVQCAFGGLGSLTEIEMMEYVQENPGNWTATRCDRDTVVGACLHNS